VLLEHNADPNIQTKDGYTSLIRASENGHIDTVRVLLEHNADPNIQTKDGDTSLIWASQKGRIYIVRLLLEHNADPNIRNNDGQTAIDVARNSDFKVFIEKQVRWNRRKGLMIMLTENGYILPSSLTPTPHSLPLKYSDIFCNERLLRLVVSYM
jgi:ankyrin repeat protein